MKIELRGYGIAGTLDQPLTELPDLEVFTLSCRGIFLNVDGNIGAFKNATRLKKLDIHDTQVGGDVMALENATELTHLYLANTRVVGDLSRLRPVQKVDVSGTRITCEGQDETLRQILLELGLTAEHVADLKSVAGIEWRMLSCRYEVLLSSCIYIEMVWLGTSNHVLKLTKLDNARPECHALKGQAVFAGWWESTCQTTQMSMAAWAGASRSSQVWRD